MTQSLCGKIERSSHAMGMERRLAAILSADVQGYSRLMGEDEVATIRTLTAHRGVMAQLIQQHRGRVVDDPGDNLLAEFDSVVEAVQCAVAMQRILAAHNADLPAHRKMTFRMGINLGDVVVEQTRLYGDDVNLAARLERLAEAGGICISGTVYDQIETKLNLRYVYLGERVVKNMPRPVRVYRIQIGSEATSPRWHPTWSHVLTLRQRVVLVAMAVLMLLLTAAMLWHISHRPAFPLAEDVSVAWTSPLERRQTTMRQPSPCEDSASHICAVYYLLQDST
jgi:adenylate cyclase